MNHYSDYQLYQILENNGYEPDEENLEVLKEGIESGRFSLLTEDKSTDTNVSFDYDGNKNVGHALVRDYGDGEKFLTNFEITQQHRGKGYGSRALDELIQKHGINSLSVNPENKIAFDMYTKRGFKTVGKPYYDKNAGENMVYMKLKKK